MTTPSGLPRKALQYWTSVYGAVNQRASTADVWAAIRNQVESVHGSSFGITLQDFNQLRSQAVAVRNSVEHFNGSPLESGLTGESIGQVPWQRDQGTRNASPIYQVRFAHTTVNEQGDESTDYRSVTFTGGLPETKQALIDAVNRDAEALADNYDTQHVSISGLQVYSI